MWTVLLVSWKQRVLGQRQTHLETRGFHFTRASEIYALTSRPWLNYTSWSRTHLEPFRLFHRWKERKRLCSAGKLEWKPACVCPTFLSLDDAPRAPFVTWLPRAAKDYLVCLWNYEIVKQLHTASFSSDVSKPPVPPSPLPLLIKFPAASWPRGTRADLLHTCERVTDVRRTISEETLLSKWPIVCFKSVKHHIRPAFSCGNTSF